MLKNTIQKLDEVEEGLRQYYKEQQDGSFILQVEGADDFSKLKAAKEHEKEMRKEAEEQQRQLREQYIAEKKKNEQIKLDQEKAKGDVDAVDASWKKKFEEREAELQKQNSDLLNNIKSSKKDSAALNLATELTDGKANNLILPHITSRLDVEIVEGVPVVKVLDKDGKPSANNLEDLKKEFFTNEEFSAIVVSSKAGGGGATGGASGGAQKKKFSDYTSMQLVELKRKDPAAYEKLKANR